MRTSIPYVSLPAKPPPAVQAYTPTDVAGWLQKRGWSTAGNSEITGDQMWRCTELDGYFTWAEAVAYEFYRFISLGGEAQARPQTEGYSSL